MKMDTREKAAAYYDLNPTTPGDINFYKERVPSADACVLELGCGTGRVLVSLVESSCYIHGMDSSEAMLARCRAKLKSAGVPSSRAWVEPGDITNFDLGRTFDLIIVPWVLQIMKTDEELDGVLGCIRKHLHSTGTCIVNVPKPPLNPDDLRLKWCTAGEQLHWDAQMETVRVTCHDRRSRMDPERLVLFSELVYRRYEGGILTDETVMSTVMGEPQRFLLPG